MRILRPATFVTPSVDGRLVPTELSEMCDESLARETMLAKPIPKHLVLASREAPFRALRRGSPLDLEGQVSVENRELGDDDPKLPLEPRGPRPARLPLTALVEELVPCGHV